MSRKVLWLFALAAAVLVAVVALLGGGGLPVTARSSLAAGAEGWLAARRYLEARGARAEVLREPLDRAARPGVLVTVSPWLPPARDGLPGIRRHLRLGGTVVVGYSGDSWSPSEVELLDDLGVELAPVQGALPLSPFRWWEATSAELRLEPRGAVEGRALIVGEPRMAPRPPAGAEILFADRARRVAVFEMRPAAGGRLTFVPAEALSNGRLRTNAGLLDILIARYGRRWSFDEYHHGLRPEAASEHVELGSRLQVFVAQLLLVYLVGLWALARRFGPAWPSRRERVTTASRFLVGLGALHHRLRHHRAAAQRLLAARGELDARWSPSAALAARAEAVDSGDDLVAIAAELAAQRMDAGGRST
ncbi:MAG: hypothetical protein ACRD2Z_06490 [Thermoanaerobaculia bacterium]